MQNFCVNLPYEANSRTSYEFEICNLGFQISENCLMSNNSHAPQYILCLEGRQVEPICSKHYLTAYCLPVVLFILIRTPQSELN